MDTTAQRGCVHQSVDSDPGRTSPQPESDPASPGQHRVDQETNSHGGRSAMWVRTARIDYRTDVSPVAVHLARTCGAAGCGVYAARSRKGIYFMEPTSSGRPAWRPQAVALRKWSKNAQRL